MGGYGSTIGGVLGGAAGTYFAPGVGTVIGSGLGSAIGGQFDKKGNKPQQTPTQMGTYDPYAHFGPQAQAIEDVLGPRMRSTSWDSVNAPGPVGDLYAGPRPEQERSLAAMEQYRQQADPAYRAGTRQLQGTIEGQYLDPMTQAPFQRLSSARQDIARQLFSDFAPEYASAAGARGNPYGSSSQAAGIQRGGERISTQAAQDIAEAGWRQYGAERGLQEAATARGLGLAPGLAAKVFEAGEHLRSAQQGANVAEAQEESRRQLGAMEGQLRAMGLDDNTIGRALEYMRLRGLQPIRPIVGPTGEEEATARMGFLGPMLAGTGKGGGGGLSSIFGSGGGGSGTIYAPSGGWATPSLQE
jgi:hypothetical protein